MEGPGLQQKGSCENARARQDCLYEGCVATTGDQTRMLTSQPGPELVDSAADPRLFREGMSRVAAAVHVVTTAGPAGQGGFTATAVTPVTDAPPSLLVCVNTASKSVGPCSKNGLFGVNALAHDDLAIADAFSGRSGIFGAERFAIGTWVPSPREPRFSCRVSSRSSAVSATPASSPPTTSSSAKSSISASAKTGRRWSIAGGDIGSWDRASSCDAVKLAFSRAALCRAVRGSSRSAARSRRGLP